MFRILLVVRACVCVELYITRVPAYAKIHLNNWKKAILDNLFGSQSHTTTKTESQIRDDELLTIFKNFLWQ